MFRFFVLSTLLSGVAHAAEIVVDPDLPLPILGGDPLHVRTVDLADHFATRGDTIVLDRGLHTQGAFVRTDGVEILGRTGAHLHCAVGACIGLLGDGQRLSNVRITGGGVGPAILAAGGQTVIESVDIEGFAQGVDVSTSGHIYIADLHVAANTRDAIVLNRRFPSAFELDRSYIAGHADGIGVAQSAGDAGGRVSIRSTRFDGSTGRGAHVDLSDLRHVNVLWSVFQGGDTHGVFVTADEVMVQSSVFDETRLVVQDAKWVRIHHPTFVGDSGPDAPLVALYNDEVEIRNGLFVQTGDHALRTVHNGPTSVQYKTFWQSGRSPWRDRRLDTTNTLKAEVTLGVGYHPPADQVPTVPPVGDSRGADHDVHQTLRPSKPHAGAAEPLQIQRPLRRKR